MLHRQVVWLIHKDQLFINMHEPVSTTAIAAHGGIAIFGAITHALNAQRMGKTKSIKDVIVLMIMSSFTGVMFSLAGLHYFPHDIYISMAAAGTGGWIGVEGLAWMSEIIKKKFNIK